MTDDYNVARRFVTVMSRGFPEYGAFVSPSKTLLSFELAPGGHAAPVASLGENGACRELSARCSFPDSSQTFRTAVS